MILRREWSLLLAGVALCVAWPLEHAIVGAGPAAQVVGDTLRAADPNVDIVGYLAGPNEREPSVPAHQILAQDDTLPRLAHRLGVDEIVVALTLINTVFHSHSG